MNPKVTVITTVFNSEKYLKKAIESILTQSFEDFEYILVDDHSSDNSVDIIHSYKDKRIKLIRNNSNQGTYAASNKAIELAKGQYIARLDSDDIAREDRFEKQTKLLDEKLNIAVVGSYVQLIDDKDALIGERKFPQTNNEILGQIFLVNPITHSASMVRKEYLNKVGGYNSQFSKSQDYNLWLNIARIGGKFYNIPEYLVQYRIHDQSIGGRSYQEQQNIINNQLADIIYDIFHIRLSVSSIERMRNLLRGKREVLGVVDIVNLLLTLKIFTKSFTTQYPKSSQYFKKNIETIKSNVDPQVLIKILDIIF